jgi:hypothetical protein
MGDKKDKETMFREAAKETMFREAAKETMFREAAKRAWVKMFIREASKRSYPIEDIVALLDEPGMTAEAVVERILSTRKPGVAPKVN